MDHWGRGLEKLERAATRPLRTRRNDVLICWRRAALHESGSDNDNNVDCGVMSWARGWRGVAFEAMACYCIVSHTSRKFAGTRR